MHPSGTPTRSHPARSGGRALVECLQAQRVSRVFCVPGESYLEVLDALHDAPEIELVVAKHEGAAAYMAEADGKLTGQPGICMVTRGPGATHASVGVHTAQQDSTPLVMFVGQIARDQTGREAFQEVDYGAMFGSLAKWVVQIDDPERVPEIVARAFHTAVSGRPGPVVVALPEDMLTAACTTPAGAATPLSAPRLAADGLSDITARLSKAQRPLLLVGGPGWSDATRADLVRFATAWNLPVACAFRRMDLIDQRDPHYVGHLSVGMQPTLAQRVRDSDCLLAIGTRLGDISTNAYTLLDVPRPAQQLLHCHADPGELNRVYQADLAVQISTADALAVLAGTSPAGTPAWSRWTTEARAELEAFVTPAAPAADLQGVDVAAVVRHVSDTLPDDAIIANGAGNYAIWVHRYYQYRDGRTQLAPTNGSMGYGLPAAIAAALRHRERDVVCFAGDGCFLMYPQELATAAEHDAALTVIVVNNGMYGTIRMHQEREHPGRVSGTRIAGPDYVALAQACGAYAERVTRAEDFPDAFARARQTRRLSLIELVVDPRQLTPQLRLS